MNNSIKVIGFAIIIMLIIFGGIEYFYKKDKCCECCEIKQYVCENEICEIKQCTQNCCRCSFVKEYFGIDLYFWK